MPDKKCVILFFSSNHAIWAEAAMKKDSIRCKMIPVPRHLSSDCGYCVEFESASLERAQDVLSRNGIEYDRIEEMR